MILQSADAELRNLKFIEVTSACPAQRKQRRTFRKLLHILSRTGQYYDRTADLTHTRAFILSETVTSGRQRGQIEI